MGCDFHHSKEACSKILSFDPSESFKIYDQSGSGDCREIFKFIDYTLPFFFNRLLLERQ